MIPRYTLPQMGKIWAQESRFKNLLEVEKAVAKVQGQLGLIPRKAAEQILKRARFDVARIQEIEKTTKHDVIAFVSSVAEAVGESGRYVHYALTSSDVLDTAMSLQIAEAGELLFKRLDHLEKALKMKIRAHKKTLCAGRTHGMQAEPTSFGLKLAGYLAEILRARRRLEAALKQARICKLSGAVGTYASQGLDVEKRVAKLLNLEVESVATQVVPRDRHAEVMVALTFVMAALERLAIEIRHLQRTEVGEAEEPFEEGQKGSSAMPHKRNPIGSENITGLSRLVRSNCFAAFENIPLWHERDISHSSVERVIFPDSFILTDYAIDRMTQIIRGLKVYPKRMLQNLELSQGQTMSSLLLLRLIEGGLTRESAYKIVQKYSHSLKPNENLIDRIKKDPEVKGFLSAKDLSELQSGRAYFKYVDEILRRVL